VAVSSSGSVFHPRAQSSRSIHTRAIAQLTLLGRERLVRRHIDDGFALAELAAQARISLLSAYKWLTRYRSGGVTALRHERCTMRRIATNLAAPLSTMERWLNTQEMGRLRNLQPREPVRQHQWAQDVAIIHLWTLNSWLVLSGSPTASLVIATRAVNLIPAARRLVSQ
jgi:hypothetical protein